MYTIEQLFLFVKRQIADTYSGYTLHPSASSCARS
jgi:hypothetical protein